MSNLFTLLILFQFKHFVADYPLQTPYMLGKFKSKGWVIPLLAHCAVHGVFTIAISFWVSGNITTSFLLSLLDMGIHFVMDRIKASPKLLGKYQALSKKEYVTLMNEAGPMEQEESLHNNKLFWWSLGLDQMVHHLTDILVVYLIVKGMAV